MAAEVKPGVRPLVYNMDRYCIQEHGIPTNLPDGMDMPAYIIEPDDP